MPRRIRQTYLGPSPQRMLCLVSRPPQPPPESLGESYISMLPDELLAEIFTYLPPETTLYRPPDYQQCPPIPVVCRQWERIYDATLYRKISFVDGPQWQQHRSSKAINTLRQQANLRSHVRNISIQKSRPSERTCRVIADTIRSCQATRGVSLHLGWSTQVWPIIHAVGMLPRLETLQLSGDDDGPSLQMILRHFNQPTIRSIHLSRYGFGRDDTPNAQRLPISHWRNDVDRLSVLARTHTSAVTSMELNEPSCPPQCTNTLLMWTPKLVRLSVSQLIRSAYGTDYTPDALQLILSIHRETLQHLTVGYIPKKFDTRLFYQRVVWTARGIPDFSKFDCLHELHLSAYNLMAEKPSEAAAKLAAPMLRHLAMNFSREEEHEEQHPDPPKKFGKHEFLWMAEFVSQKPTGGSKTGLQSVFVDFNPECSIWVVEKYEAMTWPWEYLEEAETEACRYNITVTHSKPGCTKDEWDQMVRDFQKVKEVERGSQSIEECLEALEICDEGQVRSFLGVR